MKSIKILYNNLNLLSVLDLHNFIFKKINNNEKSFIGNLNIHAANISYSNILFRSYLNNCDIVFCDGKGIQLGAWILNKPIPKQITYHTWMWELLKFCNENNFSLFFLGSKKGIAEKAIEKIRLEYPNLRLDSHHGYFNKENIENDTVINQINSFRPNILIVGFGMPLQEFWIERNHSKINTNIFLNGGAYLEWISGNQKQAPAWMTTMGFEWLYRLIFSPIRLFNRYVIGNPLFLLRILRQKYNI